MQKLSNLASQQWSTPPRIILIKFHQNQPKIAPVLEKSTLLADFSLAPFDTILKGFRSFNAENLGSVGQRAAK